MEQELLRILRTLGSPHHLRQAHARLVAAGLSASPRLLPALVAAAFSAHSPRHASAALRAAGPAASSVSHNTLIERLAGARGHRPVPADALAAYTAMLAAGVPPNGFTFTFLLRACALLGFPRPCRCVHGQIVRWGFGSEVFVQNTLLDVYYRCGGPGRVAAARQVFDEMVDRDVVSWNSIIGVYMSSGDYTGAMELFEAMPERNVVSWNTLVAGFARVGDMVTAQTVFDRMPSRNAISWNLMISGYASSGDVEAARSMFDRMDQKKDVVSWTAMVSAYAKIGDLDTAKELFDHMPLKNLVSWNAMITGYNHNSRYGEALRTFQLMMLEGRFRPDEATLVSVVSACAQLGSVEYCNWISSFIRKSNVHLTIALGNALIDMFAKCGDVGRAQSIFYEMKTRCIITWTTMISGFAFNGLCREALLVYNNMCREGVELDDMVFIAALAACVHGGLLQEGWSIFNEMVEQYNIQPRMEHYGCVVDLLGRAGNLQEAVLFIESMPLEPSVVIWATLLSSCVAHGNAEFIDYVSKKITELEPFNSSYQVLVSNSSALEGRWDGVIGARTIMRNWGIEKVPGSSSIQVGSEVHEFLAKDTMHERRKEIYETVDGLMALMRHTEEAPWPRHCSTL
ncbi:pentatricopeptide repeat-containing protein At3g29230-like [Oryza brachyantha]|uniref:CRR4 n=2 Tax=Oryza brachyantha TaxID=4533 RepID=G8JBA1_ORYBR|nr:pentatricopeptide repeat-containing protein At3g29230-like [Oryza brachyantha]XP_040382045.1 pentatricopeptide repeat-containing protein At3g29230-like [Oryza brachyantha]XP_040382046.1 pentatricopeptide repeat-containing protein At3g29230-like [Oryza brachyantha]XP_040382047.1 pentatricopeptide repeat-containing protein At3g29230-like [Oryza brachyantha]XP_040382048.1 pentatricopeptide repeat-containing protein At3g29230-like [Oryza brachyantha]XP_040382049.1 pentatricopeptide repeat-conta